uniref:NFX1-type zinc finger-containing protein 1-like isoform X2 n=1 Tax=Crassostrea virginica TaxID=6565 RepID=A0A8B8DUA2_CRAVI|nr:NFX1-type zinc finger-containing protein 1-like isoform X2 [Crassostrea virginica]
MDRNTGRFSKIYPPVVGKDSDSALSSLGLCTFLDSFIPRLIIASNNENTHNCLESIHEDLKALRSGISERLLKPEIDKRREKRDERKPPNDFRKISILPTREDIFYEPFLRKNLRSGSYENLDHYLDVQFRLLREDCIAQLRNGIYEFIEAKTVLGHREVRRLQDAKLYKNVFVVSKESSLDGPLYELQLDRHQVSHIRWEKSKRLLYGSLLCLSSDDFDTLYFAVIENADREKIKQEGKIKVSMRRGKGQSEIPLNSPMTMVESSAYFEAYRHVLKSLQTMTEEDTPFKRYIVHGNKDLRTPKYFERSVSIEFDLGPIINQKHILKKIHIEKKNTMFAYYQMMNGRLQHHYMLMSHSYKH